MKAHHLSLFLILSLSIFCTTAESRTNNVSSRSSIQRRILHQPLFPASSAPPPAAESPPPPPPPTPETPNYPNPDQPFFPEVPTGPSQDQSQQPPPATAAIPITTNGSIPIPTATQPAKPAKKVAIAISVGIVTLGMLSALAFFLYRHRSKHRGESQSQKLVGANSQRFQDERRPPPPSFLYIGTVEPSTTSASEAAATNGSPYHKLNSVKRSDRYRPSPELQPLPQLTRPPSQNENSPAAMSSSSDEESHGTAFYTPQCSSISNDDCYMPVVASSRSVYVNSNGMVNSVARSDSNANNSVPRSKRTSPRTKLSASPPEMKQVIIPSIKPQQPPLPPPPPPPSVPERLSQQPRAEDSSQAIPYSPKRPRFSSPPPPPNMDLPRSLKSNSSSQTTKFPVPPPPPPPPPPPLSGPRKMGSLDISAASTPIQVLPKGQSWTPSPKSTSGSGISKSPKKEVNRSASTSEKTEGDSTEGAKPKLKALHWDKVRATSDRATVWDQLKSSSFQLNEDMMETLFGCNTVNTVPKEPTTRKSVLPPVEKQNRVLDPKKSQNIAILLRALNVTRDEVSEALLDGNPESLGAELLETLVKMAPTKEEEIKLREYNGDILKLGSAERFLKTVLDIPFAFKRVEAMLYRANFDTEVKYLRKSYDTLEAASEELKNSRLFLKLLEAVLKTGNRMNVGTNRGDAKAFKLDTLLKLVDIKGTDGKTTLLHFVVQEIIRSEGAGTNTTNEDVEIKNTNITEDNFKKQGLQVVSGLSRDLSNVKKAAGMDSDVLCSYVSKLAMGLEKVRMVLQYETPDMQGEFFHSIKMFLKEAEEGIARIKADERRALSLVKEVTEYFHGDTAKEEAHPFRIFMIVRDFLSILDHVCKDVGKMQDRTMVGSARSFRISATASLPVLNRYNVRQDTSSDEESSSP